MKMNKTETDVTIDDDALCPNLTLKAQSTTLIVFNPLTAKLFNLNFHPLEVVSR